MEPTEQVGIYGVGYYLPREVRTNDYWDQGTTARWTAISRLASARPLLERERDPDLRVVYSAIIEYEDDPFAGAVERRTMASNELSSDLETAAARDALERAGIKPSQIDLLITFTQLPDFLTLNTAAIVHQKLGLRPGCIAVNMDALCNSFQMQFVFAEALIRSGQARYSLIVQSAGLQHLTKRDDQNSIAFGDGATAVVLGPVKRPFGLLGTAHRTDGSYHQALITGNPGRRWYEAAPFYYSGNPKLVRGMLLKSSLSGREVVEEALARAGASADDVGFYASNQPTVWYRRVTQQLSKLKRARYMDTFPWSGSLGAGNIPLQLAEGERKGLLKDGDLVATFTSGSGLTWSALVLRWGH